MAKLEVGNGYSVVIDADCFWENDQRPMHYAVLHNNTTAFGPTYFDNTADASRESFQVVETANGSVAAITSKERPFVAIIIVDRTNGFSFPGGDDSVPFPGIGEPLLERLRAEMKDQRYKLFRY